MTRSAGTGPLMTSRGRRWWFIFFPVMMVLFLASAVASILRHGRRSDWLPAYQLRAQTQQDMAAAVGVENDLQEATLRAATLDSPGHAASEGADSGNLFGASEQRRHPRIAPY